MCYKLFSEGDQGLIISIEEDYIAISGTGDEIAIYVKHDETTIIFNEKWRETDINELKIGDTIGVHTS